MIPGMSPLFQVHRLNDIGLQKAENIAVDFNTLLTNLEDTVGPEATKTREFSVVKTKLEEACFFAKKSLANQTENQKT